MQVGDKLWDIETPGLYIYKQKTKLAFYYKYRIHDTQKLSCLGSFGSLSIDDARSKARQYYLLASDGVDPAIHFKEQAEARQKKKQKEEYSIADAYHDWEEHFKPKLKPSSLSEWTLYDRYVAPKFAHRPLGSIRPEEMNSFHASIEKPYSANRSIKVLKKLYSIARKLGPVHTKC